MVVVAQPIRFDDDDPRPMLRHLDAWARRTLVSPEAWGSLLERCGQWGDYAARNQVLVASYGVAGPVAGAATWDLVPSTEPGRGCAVRVGEHGLPVRVPVIDEGRLSSERSRVGAVSESVARTHRWEAVFAMEQLARRPAPGSLTSVTVPAMSTRDWEEAVRVASGRVVGRMPRRVADPVAQLEVLTGRVPNGPGRVRLRAELVAQAGWLVADRVGLATAPLPAFDPAGLSVRERWRTAVDVRHAVRVVTGGLSHALGVDLAQSPLPRHELVDDRTVAPGRRNYLAPADVRALPLGVWVEAGPYRRSEWLARGVAGAAGTAAFLRVNERSYLAVYESRAGASWRLETTGRGSHHGLVGEGTTESLTAAKDAARRALVERFPDLGGAVDPPIGTRVASAAMGWQPLPGGRDERTQQRVLDERVAAIVSPGPGGRWETWTNVDGTLRQGPLAAGQTAARDTADRLARRALAELGVLPPDRANQLIADLASGSGVWEREALVAVVGHRLTDADRQDLASTTDPARLVDTMSTAGVLTPSTMLKVLRAEGVDADTVAGLVPAVGLSIPGAIRILHSEWGVDRLDVAAELGATVDELRAAGCTPVELLAAAPRETLRSLDGRESTWERVGPSLLEAGYGDAEAVAHLAAHAPSPDTFAIGVTTIVEDPVAAFAYAARRAEPDDLAALSERYGLDPEQAAGAMASAGVPLDRAVEAVHVRCDHDVDATFELAVGVLGVSAEFVVSLLGGDVDNVVALDRSVLDATPRVEDGMGL